jgi:hypothetical protein
MIGRREFITLLGGVAAGGVGAAAGAAGGGYLANRWHTRRGD